MDKRIDERFRKPRRTRGTPFHLQRNFWAAGIIALGGLSWFLWELMPGTKKLRKLVLEHTSEDHEIIKAKAMQFNASLTDPALAGLLAQLRDSSKSKPTTSKTSSKTKKIPSVSKYFNTKKDEINQKSTPNKKDPKNKLNDSADDFRSPMPIPKPKNIKWKLNEPKQRTSQRTNKKNSKGKAKNCTLAIIKDNFEGGDENPEHLQMAIALSKSTYEAEHGHSSELENKVPDIGEIIQNVKPTSLERFGFKKSKPTMAVESRTLRKPAVSRRAKGPKSYISRMLDIRTPQERQSIIESKIALILSQPNIATKEQSQISLTSPKLQEFKSESCILFGLDNLYEKNRFYVDELFLEKNPKKCCGFLLKNWSLIQGRDKTPTRTMPSNILEKPGSCPMKPHICIELDSDEKLSGSLEQSPIEQNTRKLSPNEIKDDAKDYLRNPLINSSDAKDSGISSLGSYCKSSLSTNRSISPDLFSSDDEYDYSTPTKNANLVTSPQLDTNIEEYKNNLKSIDFKSDDEDIPMNQPNSFARSSSFYSLNELEDNIDENSPSAGFREPNSDEDCISSPKCITKMVKMDSMEYLTDFYDEDEKKSVFSQANMTNLSLAKNKFQSFSAMHSESNTPKSSASNSQHEILPDNEGPSSFQRNIDAHISPSVNSCKETSFSPSLDFLSSPKTSASSHQRNTELLNNSDENSDTTGIGSTSDKSGNLVEDTFLEESEIKEKSLIEEPLEEISTDMDVDCPLLNHNHDDTVKADVFIDHQLNIASDSPPSNGRDFSQTQHNQSCIEILDDSSSDSVYNKPSKSPIFADKTPSINNSTPLTTTRLSSIRTSNAYNSADLNVTDYVTQMLNKDRFSFDNQDIEISEELPTSQDFVDEELNYSCHFATPMRPCREAIFEDIPEVPEAPPSIIDSISTPNKYIIKTNNITPMPLYDKMATPLINKELQKMGIKPLKRAKGSKLLQYIYESTHPLVGSVDLMEASDSESDGKIIKRRKRRPEEPSSSSVRKEIFPNDPCDSFQPIEIVGNSIVHNEKPENLIFERKQSAKIPSCRIPLQIVWHNFLSCNPTIKESILLYEPLHLEFLHLSLKEQGFKFHVQDLLTFLDKKCITIRTNQNRGKKRR